MPLNKSKKTNQENFLLNTVEYKHFKLIRLAYMLILGSEMLILAAVCWFLYINIYLTMDNIQSVVLLKEYGSGQTIPFDTLDSLEKSWQKRHSLENLNIKRNPFVIENSINVVN